MRYSGIIPVIDEVEQAGQQLACRQVARRPEQDDDVRVDLRRRRLPTPTVSLRSTTSVMAGRRSLSSDMLAPMILGTDSGGSFCSSVTQSVGSGRPSTWGQSDPKITRSSPTRSTISSTSSSQNGLIQTWRRNVSTGSSVK